MHNIFQPGVLTKYNLNFTFTNLKCLEAYNLTCSIYQHTIVIMKVSYGLVLSLLLPVIQSMSKVKWGQKAKGQTHLAT